MFTRRRRAFSLVEVLVVIVVLGILAAVGLVAYPHVTERAHAARAAADLRQLTTAMTVQAAVHSDTELTRDQLLEVLSDTFGEDVTDGLTADGVELGTATDSPTRAGQFASGFDNSDANVSNTSGTRLALVTATGGGDVFAALLTVGGDTAKAVRAPSGTTPAIVLANSSDGGVTPYFPNPPTVAPGNLTAVLDEGTAVLTWAPVTDEPGTSPVDQYRVTVTPALVGGVTELLTASPAGTFTVPGLVNHTEHTFTVSAVNRDGAGPESEAVAVTWHRPPQTVEFSASTVWVVPEGVTSVDVTLGGARGFGDGGGPGAVVSGTLTVLPGQEYYLNVGVGGGQWGGGGAADIRVGGNDLTDRVLVAAGGGGDGGTGTRGGDSVGNSGGVGGALGEAGGDGLRSGYPYGGGKGGSQTHAGTSHGTSGGLGQGGDGAVTQVYYYGGGGGGGYYGGGGGQVPGAWSGGGGGGGGSSWAAETVTGTSSTRGANVGAAFITLTY